MYNHIKKIFEKVPYNKNYYLQFAMKSESSNKNPQKQKEASGKKNPQKYLYFLILVTVKNLI